MSDGSLSGNRLLSGTIIIFCGNLLAMGLDFLTRVSLTKLLSPGEYGLLILGLIVLNVGERFSSLSVSQTLARNLTRSEDSSGYVAAGIVIAVAVSSLVGAAIAVLAPVIAAILSKPELAPIVRIVAFGIPLAVAFDTIIGSFRGIADARYPALLTLVRRVSMFVGLLTPLAFTHGLAVASVGLVAGLSLTLVVAAVSVHRATDLTAPVHRWPTMTARHGLPILRFSVTLVGFAAVWTLMHQTDTLLLGAFDTSEQVGVYDAAYTLARVFTVITFPLQFLFLPIFSDLHETRDVSRMRNVYRLTTKWMVLAALPLLFVVLTFSREFLEIIFRPPYAAATPALIVLSVAFFGSLVFGANQQALIATGQNRRLLRTAVGALACNVVLNVALIPKFGIVGAAVATTVAYLGMNVGLSALLYRNYTIVPLSRTVLLTSSASGLVYLAFVSVARAAANSDLVVFTAFVVVFLPLYVLTLLVTGGFSREDVGLIRSLNSEISTDISSLANTLERYVD